MVEISAHMAYLKLRPGSLLHRMAVSSRNLDAYESGMDSALIFHIGPLIRVYRGCRRRGMKVLSYRSPRAPLRINEATAYGLDDIATWLDESVIVVAFIC